MAGECEVSVGCAVGANGDCVIAVVEALREVNRDPKVGQNYVLTIKTDKPLIVKVHNQGWLGEWEKVDWRYPDGTKRSNADLWQNFADLTTHGRFTVRVEYPNGGHTDNYCCENAQMLASKGAAMHKSTVGGVPTLALTIVEETVYVGGELVIFDDGVEKVVVGEWGWLLTY